MSNESCLKKDFFMLKKSFSTNGFDCWRHIFIAENSKTHEQKTFFINFFVCNPDLQKDEPVLGQWIPNQINNQMPSYLMVKVGTFGEDACQIHRFFSWKDVLLEYDYPFCIATDDCYCSESETRGSICLSEEESNHHPEYMCEYGEMSWNIKIFKRIAFNSGNCASDFFNKSNMFWHAEGAKTSFEGELLFNGIKYNIKPETCNGYSDKIWGKSFANPWIFISSNDLISKNMDTKLENSVFTVGGVFSNIFKSKSEENLLSELWYEGKSYEFNPFKFWTMCETRFVCKETEDEVLWHIRQETNSAVLEVKVRCAKKDMLLLNYEAPNGKKSLSKLWSGGTGKGMISLWQKKHSALDLIDEVYAENIKCEYGYQDT